MSNQNINLNAETLQTLTNLAGTGAKLFDDIVRDVTPKVEKAMGDVFTNLTTFNNNNQQSARNNNSNKSLVIYENETENAILIACELPRINKTDCSVKLENTNTEAYDNNLVIRAKTQEPPDDFKFLECINYEKRILVPHYIKKNDISVKYMNGMLYITINKKKEPITESNINIA